MPCLHATLIECTKLRVHTCPGSFVDPLVGDPACRVYTEPVKTKLRVLLNTA